MTIVTFAEREFEREKYDRIFCVFDRDSPDTGHGAKNEKSYRLAGGAMVTKPVISGRRMSSWKAIQAPNENPHTQHPLAFRLKPCIQSSAAAASLNSP